MIDVDDFVANVIPGLVNGRKRLRVLFSTHNQIHGYRDGKLDIKEPGLEVLVADGGVQVMSWAGWFDWTNAMINGDVVKSMAYAERIRSEADDGQSKIAEKLAGQDEYPDVAVIYAGLSAFESTMATVRELRACAPDAHIVVLTCDCDVRSKSAQLHRDNVVDTIVVTPRCGGCDDVGTMLEALVGQWSKREAPQAVAQ